MTDAPRVLFPEPVWYEPLRSPAWLLPALREDAISVLFAPEADAEEGGDEALRLGLPLALAEAVRYTTDASTSACLVPPSGTEEAAATVRTGVAGEAGDRVLRVRVASGEQVLHEASHPVPDDAALGVALAGLPAEVVGALREAGVRPVWATAYAPPAPARAVSNVRAHRGCAWLQDSATFALGGEPGDQGALRVQVRAALAAAAEHANRDGGPLGAALFLASVAAAKAGNSAVYIHFRLQANAIALTERNPRDPMSLLSVVALSLFGEAHSAEQRAQALGASAEPDVKRWLARARTIG
ncbi:MAG: hypothetical protein ACXVWF_06955 [Actinomycetota bacterium]